MPTIQLHTYIQATTEVVFNLSRSVELHQLSTANTNEKAVAGVTKGLLGANDVVTWRAKHLGFYQTLTTKITRYNPPYFFEDVMQQGIFKAMEHKHYFKQEGAMVCMTDVFMYKAPLGILGKLADVLFLKRYMRRFLIQRNGVIKQVAEGNQWQALLG